MYQQTDLLGHPGVTAATVAAHAPCDEGGPKIADSGLGADWICMLTYHDEKGAAQDGKFELQVKTNSCYSASGPPSSVVVLTTFDQNAHVYRALRAGAAGFPGQGRAVLPTHCRGPRHGHR